MNQKTKAEILRRVVSPSIICSAFILCAALGMLIYPEAFHKFFSPSQLAHIPPPELPHRSYYWDVEHYANMALSNVCNAFYPLWPLIVHNIFQPKTVDQAAHSLLLLATIISFISIFILLFVFEQALNTKYLAFLLVLAYTLNPMAIFRYIGYTESLFSILSIIFMWCFCQQKIQDSAKLSLLAITTFLMCLTRSALVQILFSAIASLCTILYFEIIKLKNNRNRLMTYVKKYSREIKATIVLCVSAILGYSAYGIFCLNSRGDFFAPFHDQKNWGKSLGLHLELLLTPKSLLFDLLGLYLPLIVFFLALVFVYFKLRKEKPLVFIPKSASWNVLLIYPPLLLVLYIFNSLTKKNKKVLKKLETTDFTETLGENYLFWFCIYFSIAQVFIVLFTQDRLASLARYVFAVPFFFLALGYLYRCIPGEKKYQTILWFICISAIALVHQWVNYGKNEWLG